MIPPATLSRGSPGFPITTSTVTHTSRSCITEISIPNVVNPQHFDVEDRREFGGPIANTKPGQPGMYFDPKTVEFRIYGRPTGTGKPHVEVAALWDYEVVIEMLSVPMMEALTSIGQRVTEVVRTFEPASP